MFGNQAVSQARERDDTGVSGETMPIRSLTSIMAPQTLTLNTQMFGLKGHSLASPHSHMEQQLWTEDWINTKVTRRFIESKLRSDERNLLLRPLVFGDGLTDDTYLDWILQRARKLFLILADVGVPDQIFGVIDDSWDDNDLPIPLDMVGRLALTFKPDEALDKRFYEAQFKYMLRELHEGTHMDYEDTEVVPMEIVNQVPAAASLQSWPRVQLPSIPEQVLMRRRISLGAGSKKVDRSDFIADLELSKLIRNDHIAPIYASYTAKGAGYVLTPFVGTHTLKTYLESRTTPQYAVLPKPKRQEMLLRWIHCLACAVADLHRDRFYHSAISPSNILIDADNQIAFADVGSFKSFQKDKKIDDTELYDYAPPEAYPRPVTVVSTSILSSRSTVPSSSSSLRMRSFSSASLSKYTSNVSRRPSETRPPSSSEHLDDMDVHVPHDFEKPPTSPSIVVPEASEGSFTSVRGIKERGDIFSLGCIFLDILTFLLKKKPSDATKHRQSKIKLHGRGSSSIDTSYHVNVEKANSWTKKLEDVAFDVDDQLFRAVPPLLHLIREMLTRDPEIRPNAEEVRAEISKIMRDVAKISPALHCCSAPPSTSITPSLTSASTIPSGQTSTTSAALRTTAAERYRRGSNYSNAPSVASSTSSTASTNSSPALNSASQREKKAFHKQEKAELKREYSSQMRAKERKVMEASEPWQRPIMTWVG